MLINNATPQIKCNMLQGQKQRRRRRRQRQANYLPGLLIVLLVLLQNFELHMCRQLISSSSDYASSSSASSPTDSVLLKDINEEPMELAEKRSAIADPSSTRSQPEEIFSAPNDATDMSYDEYPMVVPKRAALLLDRLMVALHHALENERNEGHRIGEFYANKNIMSLKPTEYKNGMEQLHTIEEGINAPQSSHTFHMYSDDDPGVLMDYDFKDLNQINRATGETHGKNGVRKFQLMAKSFQRRAGGVSSFGTAPGLDATSTALPGAGAGTGTASGAGGRRSHHIHNGGGRMYWRCYFNAVSCF